MPWVYVFMGPVLNVIVFSESVSPLDYELFGKKNSSSLYFAMADAQIRPYSANARTVHA